MLVIQRKVGTDVKLSGVPDVTVRVLGVRGEYARLGLVVEPPPAENTTAGSRSADGSGGSKWPAGAGGVPIARAGRPARTNGNRVMSSAPAFSGHYVVWYRTDGRAEWERCSLARTEEEARCEMRRQMKFDVPGAEWAVARIDQPPGAAAPPIASVAECLWQLHASLDSLRLLMHDPGLWPGVGSTSDGGAITPGIELGITTALRQSVYALDWLHQPFLAPDATDWLHKSWTDAATVHVADSARTAVLALLRGWGLVCMIREFQWGLPSDVLDSSEVPLPDSALSAVAPVSPATAGELNRVIERLGRQAERESGRAAPPGDSPAATLHHPPALQVPFAPRRAIPGAIGLVPCGLPALPAAEPSDAIPAGGVTGGSAGLGC